jgi:hypothetical protein
VYATAADNSFLGIDDGNTVTYSSMLHSGTPGWEWLTVTKTLTSSPATVEVRCYSLLDNNVMFDGAMCVEGASAFAFSPRPLVLKQSGTFVATGVTAVTIAISTIAITDMLLFSLNTVGGTVGAVPAVQTISALTGCTIKCTAGDTSTYNYMAVGI